MMGGGGPSYFFGSDILAKSDSFGSIKGAGIFLGWDRATIVFSTFNKHCRRLTTIYVHVEYDTFNA